MASIAHANKSSQVHDAARVATASVPVAVVAHTTGRDASHDFRMNSRADLMSSAIVFISYGVNACIRRDGQAQTCIEIQHLTYAHDIREKEAQRINARCDAEYKPCATTCKARWSTRHELMRQLPHSCAAVKPLKKKTSFFCLRRNACIAVSFSSDHFEPLVSSGIPSGIIPTDVEVVPCCSWCNSSKGGRTWQSHVQRLKKLGKLKDNEGQRMKVLSDYADFEKNTSSAGTLVTTTMLFSSKSYG